MHICPCWWALGISKKMWIQTYSELVTVDSVEISHHFVFWHHGTRLANFLIEPMNCIFWGASFKLIQNLATLVPEKLQGFYEPLLYHCYTLFRNGRLHWPNRHEIFIFRMGPCHEVEQKREKISDFLVPNPKKPGPGRITRMLRADTGDSVGRPGDSVGWFRCYWWSNHQSTVRIDHSNDQKHCENWRYESGSDFHKTSPMCERSKLRKQLRNFIIESLKQTPFGSGTISSLLLSEGYAFTGKMDSWKKSRRTSFWKYLFSWSDRLYQTRIVKLSKNLEWNCFLKN